MTKKIISLFIIATLMLALSACSPSSPQQSDTSDRLKITATVFAHYDFARRVAGEAADVSLLLNPGVEVHTYEPSPADIIKIQESDLFLYTGKYMEFWAEGIVNDLDEGTRAVDMSQGITLLRAPHNDHDHTGHEAHIYAYDPHIWTSPANAIIMVQSIAEALCEADPKNAAKYQHNAQEYIDELGALDSDFADMINSAQKRKIIFGGRFAMLYFTERYGLEYKSAYSSCSSDAEPGARLIAEIIDEVRAENIGAIYYEEMSNHTIADQISAETGVPALLLHTCHNVSRDELENGETYISLMRRNLENLKKGLS